MKNLFRLLKLLGLPILEFGGGKSSGPSKSEKAAQKKAEQQQKKELAAYKKALKPMSFDMSFPDMSAFIPPPVTIEPTAPASTMSAAEQSAASEDARRQAAKRRGLLSTIVAGESPAQSLLGQAGGLKGKLGQ